ncbi:Uncharacterised protein [Yersinia pseudotuberculosis]|nr:Uncharacterised protein [Yersinia pseudotuberculosis]
MQFIVQQLQGPLGAVHQPKIVTGKIMLTQLITDAGIEPFQYFTARLRLFRPQVIPLADHHTGQQLAALGETGQAIFLGAGQRVIHRRLQIHAVGAEQGQRQ